MTDVARDDATDEPDPSDESELAVRAADVVERAAIARAAERPAVLAPCACTAIVEPAIASEATAAAVRSMSVCVILRPLLYVRYHEGMRGVPQEFVGSGDTFLHSWPSRDAPVIINC